MRIEFGRTGSERKEMVTAMGEILGMKPKYMGMPSAAYRVGYFTVTKDGAVECGDGTDIRELLGELSARGIEPISEANLGEAEPETAGEAEKTDAEEDFGITGTSEEPEGIADPEPASGGQDGDRLTIEMPRGFYTAAALENLRKIVDSKAELIKKAVGAEELPISIGDDTVGFPWFSAAGADESKAYADFISKLSIMAKEAKRVTAKEKPLDGSSEKYAFRCFLLRLGFIGTEYKQDRKVLMRNLDGSSAFRMETPEKEDEEA